MVKIIDECGGSKLKSLNITDSPLISDITLLKISQCCPNLETLLMRNLPLITDVSLVAIARHCPKLTVLNMSHNKKGMDISDISMVVLGKGCPLLQRLTMNNSMKVTDIGVVKVIEGCRDMRMLNLGFCSVKITEETFSQFGKGTYFYHPCVVEAGGGGGGNGGEDEWEVDDNDMFDGDY